MRSVHSLAGRPTHARKLSAEVMKKLKYLEKAKDAEVYPQTYEQPRAALELCRSAGNAEADDIIEARRAHKHCGEPPALRQRLVFAKFRPKLEWIADKEAGVEKVTAQEQPGFAPGIAAQCPMHGEDDREENEKDGIDEKHRRRELAAGTGVVGHGKVAVGAGLHCFFCCSCWRKRVTISRVQRRAPAASKWLVSTRFAVS